MRNADPFDVVCNVLFVFRALGVPATDYVMEGRIPVHKLGGLSLPLDSPARETLSLLRKNGCVYIWACFSAPPAPSLPHGPLLIQPGSSWGGSSTQENDWQVSVGVCQGLHGGSRLYSRADGQTGSCHNLQTLLSGRIFFFPLWICAHVTSFISHFLPSRMKMWTSDTSISASLPCQDLSVSNLYFTQLLPWGSSLHLSLFFRFLSTVSLQCWICFISASTKKAVAVWVQGISPTSWRRCWAFLNTKLKSFMPMPQITAASLKVSCGLFWCIILVITFGLTSALFTSEHLLRVLNSHPTYQRVLNEYLHPDETGSLMADGKAINNNSNTHNSNRSPQYKKLQ